MDNLSGKIVLVTGAGGEFGIGSAIAMRLAENSAHLAVSDLTESPYPNKRIGLGWFAAGCR